MNGVDSPILDEDFGMVGGYKLYHAEVDAKQHIFDVVLGPKANITLATYKDLVSVSLVGGAVGTKYFHKTQGLMGSFNGTFGGSRWAHDYG